MAASLTEVLMGLGDVFLELDWEASIAADLIAGEFAQILLYEGERPIATRVLLRPKTPRSGIIIGGRSLEWYLGLDKDGPMIRERSYVASTNKLSNPGFELFDAGGNPLYWKVSEQSKWTTRGPQAALAHSGLYCAETTDDLGKDDVLTGETFSIKPGQEYELGAWVKRDNAAPGVGRLRLRALLEGKFDPDDLLEGVAWTDVSENPGDTAVVGSTLVAGPVTQKQVVPNPSFETGDLTDWLASGGVAGWSVVDSTIPGWLPAHTGRYYALFERAAGGTGGESMLICDHGGDGGAAEFWLVAPGESWRADGFTRQVAGNLGFAQLLLALNRPNRAGEPYDFAKSEQVVGDEDVADNPAAFRYLSIDYQVPTADPADDAYVNALQVWLYVSGADAGDQVGFDDIRLTRTKGNTAERRADPVPVIPERAYRLLAPVTADAGTAAGDVRLVVKLSAAGRPDQSVISTAVDFKQTSRTLLDFSFTPPSGYDTATVSVVWTDVLGGRIVVNELPNLTQSETTSMVVDDVSAAHTAGAYGSLGTDVVIPAGAEKLTLQAIAEAGGAQWFIDDASVVRVGGPTPAVELVRDALVDPLTENPLLLEGALHAAGDIAFDLDLLNTTNRELLTQVSQGGLVEPFREWRVNTDASLDWGLPEELYEDRTDIVLVENTLLVLNKPDVDPNYEKRVTRVVVIGADRPVSFPGASPSTITGEASSSPRLVDWFGNPLERTRIVQDSRVDHKAYADAFAAYLADQDANPDDAVSVDVSDARAFGGFAVGDWLYVYKPDAGLEDPENELSFRGRRIHPRRVRVLSRKLRMGQGYRAKLRRVDGTLEDVTKLVRWEKKTAASIDVGDYRPDFAVNPQGPAAGLQFLRFRASTPR